MDDQQITDRRKYYRDYYIKNKEKYTKKYDDAKLNKYPSFRKKKQVYGFKRIHGDFILTFD
tara:strand:- start:2635 stop:2817 length:183 start_codon:yes stop_codon:yes gene_type:complete